MYRIEGRKEGMVDEYIMTDSLFIFKRAQSRFPNWQHRRNNEIRLFK